MFNIWRENFNCVRSTHKNYHLCVCTQILVKYSTCKFIAFKKEVNSFKSGILILANIISCHWIRQSKSTKHKSNRLLFHLILLIIHIRASQTLLYLSIIRSLFKKYWFQGKRIKRQDMMRGKKVAQRIDLEGWQRDFKRIKKSEKKNIRKRKRKKKTTEVKFPKFKKVFSLHTVMDHLESGNKIKRSGFCF